MIRNSILIALFLTSLAGAAPAADGDLLERSPCVFPPYEKLKGIDGYASKPEYETAVADTRFTCEKLKYSSNGLPVIAYSYRPVSAGKLPLIVFNRGSYVVSDQAPILVAMFHRLASEGFAVLAPMYRGSDGAPGHDEMGGADLNELKNILPLAKGLGFADLQSVFLYGESRGGVMTFLALRDGFPARAAATFGGFTDLAAYLQADPRASQVSHAVWPDYDQRKDEILASRSVIQWPERINAPLLLMHGGADRQVSPQQTLNLAAKLQQLGKPYSLSIFAGDNHILSAHRIERDRQAVRWFQEHLN